MKKLTTTMMQETLNKPDRRLTVGLDLGDRSSFYCVLDEAGDVLMEQRLSTTPKAVKEIFGAMPRSRIALETGTHSPWVSRLLSELGHEAIVAHARSVRLIGESRRKDDRIDARTLARLVRIDPQLLCPVKHRSAEAPSGPDGDPGASRPGAYTDDVGQRGARPDEVLRRAAPRMQRTRDEAEGGPGSESGVEECTGTDDERDRVGQRTDLRVRPPA